MKSIFILPLFLLVINPAYAKMNKCKSPEGKLFYSQFACPDSHSQIQHNIKKEKYETRIAREKIGAARLEAIKADNKAFLAKVHAKQERARLARNARIRAGADAAIQSAQAQNKAISKSHDSYQKTIDSLTRSMYGTTYRKMNN